jgi:hypothetical protein
MTDSPILIVIGLLMTNSHLLVSKRGLLIIRRGLLVSKRRLLIIRRGLLVAKRGLLIVRRGLLATKRGLLIAVALLADTVFYHFSISISPYAPERKRSSNDANERESS